VRYFYVTHYSFTVAFVNIISGQECLCRRTRKELSLPQARNRINISTERLHRRTHEDSRTHIHSRQKLRKWWLKNICLRFFFVRALLDVERDTDEKNKQIYFWHPTDYWKQLDPSYIVMWSLGLICATLLNGMVFPMTRSWSLFDYSFL
jgi:hypothetical protein